MNLISCVVPCYNEEQALPYFCKEIESVAKELFNKFSVNLEVIFVNDGSKDGTLTYLKEITQNSDIFKFVSFSRNFGKESAMLAGLTRAKGDYVAILDADMQDPPKLLLEMYEILQNEEYDCVASRRVTRKGEPMIRSFFARMFYKIINKISDVDVVDGARDFRLMKRVMVDAILSMDEYNRFSKGIFGWVGFKTKWIDYENVERVAGETKWSFIGLFIYSLQGIIAFSTAPLAFASLMGILCCMLSVFAIIIIIAKTLIFGDPVDGWPSMICIVIFMGGLQLFSTGILGQYLAKAYLETKKRPHYIIAEKSEN